MLFPQAGQNGFDRFAVFPGWLFFPMGPDHALAEQRQNQGKLFFARGLCP
jgi:hypothetical protein